ncbi:hypothetical protein Hdeb2414_s0001g00015481 [Helianthus debilis subsp. tardiflorus]
MNIVADQDVAKANENVEAATGGETVKETFVEGEVHTDSSDTESNIEITKMAPTSYVSGMFRLKTTPKRKKGSDDDDATYELTPVEKEKLKKKGLRKRKAQPTGDMSRRQRARKITASIPEQIPEIGRVESVEVEISVHNEFRIATPPASPIPVQEKVRVTTHKQPTGSVEEPGSTRKKVPTPRQEGSSSGFPKVPSNHDADPTGLEDFGDFFNDGKINVLSKKVADLEKSKTETEEKLNHTEAENVVLKNEIAAMNERLLDVEAGNKALNEAMD